MLFTLCGQNVKLGCLGFNFNSLVLKLWKCLVLLRMSFWWNGYHKKTSKRLHSIHIGSLPPLFFFCFFLSRAHTLSKIGHRFALGKGWLIFQQKLILLNWKNENNFKVKFGVPLTSQLSKYAQKSNKRIILK